MAEALQIYQIGASWEKSFENIERKSTAIPLIGPRILAYREALQMPHLLERISKFNQFLITLGVQMQNEGGQPVVRFKRQGIPVVKQALKGPEKRKCASGEWSRMINTSETLYFAMVEQKFIPVGIQTRGRIAYV